MLEIFQYDFMVRAFLAGSIAALVVPLLGSFLVARRYALIADSLAHVSLAGVGIGLVVHVSPVMVAIPVAVCGAVLLEYIRQNRRLSGEVSLAVIMSGGLALAVVLAGLSGGRVDFNAYLFGSITTTAPAELWQLGAVGTLVAGFIAWQYQALLHIAFDEDSAKVAGVSVVRLNYIMAVLTALTVVVCLRIFGGLLIGALLVIPVVTASQLAGSFKQTLLLAVCVALVSVVCGLFAAFYLGVAAGAAIVLCSIVILVMALVVNRSQ